LSASKSASNGIDTAAVRAWAAANGVAVSSRGRIKDWTAFPPDTTLPGRDTALVGESGVSSTVSCPPERRLSALLLGAANESQF
jgi:hypothetical protein